MWKVELAVVQCFVMLQWAPSQCCALVISAGCTAVAADVLSPGHIVINWSCLWQGVRKGHVGNVMRSPQ